MNLRNRQHTTVQFNEKSSFLIPPKPTRLMQFVSDETVRKAQPLGRTAASDTRTGLSETRQIRNRYPRKIVNASSIYKQIAANTSPKHTRAFPITLPKHHQYISPIHHHNIMSIWSSGLHIYIFLFIYLYFTPVRGMLQRRLASNI